MPNIPIPPNVFNKQDNKSPLTKCFLDLSGFQRLPACGLMAAQWSSRLSGRNG